VATRHETSKFVHKLAVQNQIITVSAIYCDTLRKFN